MVNSDPIKLILNGNFSVALKYINREEYPLETAYALFLSGNLIEAEFLLHNIDSIRANWLKELICLIKTDGMPNVTYFQIRNFLELDIDLLIRAQKTNYLEKLLAYSVILTEVNKETYKLISRVLFNNNLISLAKYYFDLYKDVVFYDPELHFMYAKYYILKKEYQSALKAINYCLEVLPEYFPARKLKQEILINLNEK